MLLVHIFFSIQTWVLTQSVRIIIVFDWLHVHHTLQLAALYLSWHLDQRQESTETDKVFPRYYYYSIVLSATEEILPSYYYYIRKNIVRSYHMRRLLFFFSKCLAKNIDIIRKENIKIWRVFLTTFLFFKKWLSSWIYYISWIIYYCSIPLEFFFVPRLDI